jgi:hypothetical protein
VVTKTVVSLVDDLTGEGDDDVESLSFGIDGATYEIDLSEDNAAALRDALATYIAAARRTGGRRHGANRPGRGGTVTAIASSSTTRSAAANRAESREIREWAQAKGFQVAARGRIPEDIRERWATEQKRKAAGIA